MSGYLYFERTGHKEVDKILCRIEQAGHGYHHTSEWDESENGQPSYIDKINEAIREAKAALTGTNK
jgi:hypothetical protein